MKKYYGSGIEKSYPLGFIKYKTNDDLGEWPSSSSSDDDDYDICDDFRKELESLINRHSQENSSNTSDFILAEYLIDCLDAFNKATNKRTKWYK